MILTVFFVDACAPRICPFYAFYFSCKDLSLYEFMSLLLTAALSYESLTLNTSFTAPHQCTPFYKCIELLS